MIQQVIVVEGKSDIARVRQAVDADLIATGGYALRSAVIQDIRAAYEKRGIIILTDPDGPGEKIRSRLSVMFPEALHAFVPKSDASPESIRKALDKVRILYQESSHEFHMEDLWNSGLTGAEDATGKRASVGAILGIGYGNAKQFLRRLNHFGITRKEWESALEECGRKYERR